jgi:hypothetical protein
MAQRRHHQGKHKYKLQFHERTYRHVNAAVTVHASKSHAISEMAGVGQFLKAPHLRSADRPRVFARLHASVRVETDYRLAFARLVRELDRDTPTSAS